MTIFITYLQPILKHRKNQMNNVDKNVNKKGNEFYSLPQRVEKCKL